jgi:hypothetical protein
MMRHRLVALLACLAALTLSPAVRAGPPTWADQLTPQAVARHPARPFLPLIGMTLTLLVASTAFGPCRALCSRVNTRVVWRVRPMPVSAEAICTPAGSLMQCRRHLSFSTTRSEARSVNRRSFSEVCLSSKSVVKSSAELSAHWPLSF